MPQLFTLPKQVPLNAGNVLPGAKLHFYQTGTSTPQDTYQDIDLTTPHSNPVIADASGAFPAIYLDPSLPNYRVRLSDASDALQWQEDGVPSHEAAIQSIYLTDTDPSIVLTNTNAAANQGKFKIYVGLSGELKVALLNDAESVQTDVVEIQRSGNTPLPMRIDTRLFIEDYEVESGVSVVKNANTTRTSTTSLAADPHLSVDIRESGRYRVDVFLKFVGVSTGAQGFKHQLVASGGTVTEFAGSAVQYINGTSQVGPFTCGTVLSSYATIATDENYVRHTSFLSIATTGAETLALHWAQNSSSSNGTTLQSGSALILTKVGAG